MPAYARREIVPSGEVGVYHCVARSAESAMGVPEAKETQPTTPALPARSPALRASNQGFLPIPLEHYLSLLD